MRLAFLLPLSLLIMLTDNHFKYLPEIRQILATAIYPLQIISTAPVTAYARINEIFSSNQQLINENRHLKRQHFIDSTQVQGVLALETENKQLRKLLEIRQQDKNKAVMVEIVSIPRDPFSYKITVDKGSQNGIQPGQVAIDDVGVIGQVTRTYPWSSEITLITDPEHFVPVQTIRNGLRSVVSGTGKDGILTLNYLAINADIQEGDLLVTSGIDGIYPPGLLVAVVSKIERDVAHTFARIICAPVAGVNLNRQLLVLSPLLPGLEDLTKKIGIQIKTKER